MKIVFLLDNAYGIGGTIRSTVNLSGALAERHQVEVVSLRRTRDEPALTFDPRVTQTSLIDLRRSSDAYDGDHPLYRQPSERFVEGHDHFERGISTRLGDVRLEELLADLEADVVIGTRPKINDYLAGYGTDRYLRIGQEHLTHAMHSDHIRTHQDASIAQLDAFVTVSYADAADYRGALPGTPAQIVCIPNAVPATGVEPSDGQAKLIVAAGRLIKVKRYDRLLGAFALVSQKHPDWSLRLYGRGKQHAPLRGLINELGLYDRAFLMGAHSPIETEWAKGSIAAVSSDAESFGMTLVEAMHCGVPVVSTDCRYGPGEIIANGKDGLLSPLGESEDLTVRAYADALLQLIEDPDLRARMSRAALQKAARYAPQRIAGEYERLIEQLLTKRRGAHAAVGNLSESDIAGTLSPGTPSPDATSEGEGRSDPSGTGNAGSTGSANSAGNTEPTGKAAPDAGAPSEPAARAARRTAPSAGSRRPLTPRRLLARVLRPLLRRVRKPKQGTPKRLRRPVARVRVERDGSLLVRLRADKLPSGPAAFVLRPRRRDAEEPLRMPLPARVHADADGWVGVRVSRAAEKLSEARWDAYVERGSDGKRKRVQAAMVETARLLTLPPPLDQDGAFAPWIPYTTGDGYLAVRAWHRAGHAEVTSIALDPEGFTLRARLYGEAAHGPAGEGQEGAGPVLVAVPRRNPDHAFEFPARLGPDNGLPGELNADNGLLGGPGADGPATRRTHTSPGTSTRTNTSTTPGTDGGSEQEPDGPHTVTVELPYELPAAFADGAAEDVWDLWLRPAEGRAPVRLGRLLGDLADRKQTDISPRARLGGSDLAVQLYFSLNNNLVLILRPVRQEPATAHEGTAGERQADAAGAQNPSESPSSSTSA
ncbi:glycosyltransferase [Streptomyces sp. NBC_01186]|uniref:glycosyltransferase n=1 Tax=unclassified Streptomyces TaxID=2593676 RepID=UPI002DD9033E|nr:MULTISPECIES: glycosyltransferase [unclassified Streptomyces]WSB78812.1 glycosyltransferase [Streptomyces sp. NBC_01775]WSS12985.1 glycosyltransferase [Streptomyces sp. NBC_01186]